MVLGVGIDLAEVNRIRASMEKFGDRFVRRILRAAEEEYCRKFRHPEIHIAARFAAKEAISKAFGTGIGHVMGWLDLEITHQAGGAPSVILHDRALAELKRRGATRVLVSLSHTQQYATAMALLVMEPDPVPHMSGRP